jgi:hypothetical protein
MFRKLFTVLTIVFAAGVVNAQSSTSISASSITDSFGHPVISARLCFQPVDATNTPTGFRVGSVQVVTTPVCGVVSNGVLQSGLSVVPNPTETYYHITAANRTTGATLRDYGMTQITGSSWTLDSYDPSTAILPVSAITMGTVTTVAPGTGASCTTTGSGPVLLNCSIPKGNTGATGATGPTGAIGATGPTGATGAVGTFNFRGTWAATTSYALNDTFSQGGSAYFVSSAYTSGSTFGTTDTAHAQILGAYTGVSPDGSSGLTVTGNVKAATVNASVNTQINVMAYGAKGDCTTDDNTAILAAQAAANAQAVGNTLPGAIYFPKPPGGCYLTSTIEWTGVSLIGQPSGVGPASPSNYGISIRGEPGQDVLHVPDPMVTTFAWNANWTIRDISFLVDNNVCTVNSATCTIGSNPTFPHRFTGRFVDDGAMLSGSAVFKSPNAFIGCGDVGQAIQVNGAGVGGANLVTTIASVAPCWANSASTPIAGWKVVTLAATASTTVSSAHTHIAILGDSVTTTFGNCAIAMDNYDGNPAHWVSPTQKAGSNQASMENVAFDGVGTNWSNSGCGIFTQGAHILYATRVRNFGMYTLAYGVVQAGSELNSYYTSGMGDFETWEHAFMQVYEPWISYNGIDNRIQDVEFNASEGPQILGYNNTAFDIPSGWHISLPEFETTGTPTTYGMRITGIGHTIEGTSLSSLNQNAVLDTENTTCNCSVSGGTAMLYAYGSGNVINGVSPTQVTDQGRGNSITNAPAIGSPFNGLPDSQFSTPIPTKNRADLKGSFYPDFLADGNPSTPYKKTDLWIWPQDFVVGNSGGTTPYSNFVQADAASPSGEDFIMAATGGYTQWQQFPSGPFNIVIGTTIPAAPATVSFALKCGSTVTGTLSIHINTTGGLVAGSNTLSCSTTLQTYSLPINFTAQTGNFSFVNNNAFPVYVGWIYVQPNDFDGE